MRTIFNAPVYDPFEFPTINHSNVCGWCGHKASEHPFISDVPGASCNRSLEEVGSTLSRFENADDGIHTVIDVDQYGLPIESYEGPAIEGTRTDSASRNGEQYDRWFTNPDVSVDNIASYYDRLPDEHTVTLEEYRNGKPALTEYQQHRSIVSFSGVGFITEDVYNEHLTELYHNRLLNIFTNKRGRVQIGSIELLKCVDGSIDARCVRNDCPGVLNTGTSELSREAMEDFVLSIIRHGNNHAASWFTNRPEFYKVHADNCNLTCDPRTAYCKPTQVTSKELERLQKHFTSSAV